LKELEAKMAEKKKIEEKIRQGSKDITEKDKIIASLTHSNHHQQQQKATKEEQASGTETERSKKLVYSKYTTGEMSRSFTSSAMTPMTLNLAAIASQDELHEQRWFDVRKMKKKGYVRLVTNKGDINLEIDCDFVPRTADNFMTLCERGYYEGTIFHRIIQGFMVNNFFSFASFALIVMIL
jgi:peptidyl-prolyl cis-trans isomerase-like protein 2